VACLAALLAAQAAQEVGGKLLLALPQPDA